MIDSIALKLHTKCVNAKNSFGNTFFLNDVFITLAQDYFSKSFLYVSWLVEQNFISELGDKGISNDQNLHLRNVKGLTNFRIEFQMISRTFVTNVIQHSWFTSSKAFLQVSLLPLSKPSSEFPSE